jgi:hypothetical protein
MASHFLNIALAVVRGRTREARHMIRTLPAFAPQDSTAVGKLQEALAEREEKAVNAQLHRILAESLALNVDDTPPFTAAYFDGVRAVEDLIEKYISDALPPEPSQAKEFDDPGDYT